MPFIEKEMRMYKVILWGMGDGYNSFIKLHGYEMVDVVAIIDSDTKKIKKLDGIQVVEPQNMGVEFDFIIVTVIDDSRYKEILLQALEIGVKREAILPLRVFNIPFFNFDDYIEIKKKNISIISDSCFAGFLYHRFAMRFNRFNLCHHFSNLLNILLITKMALMAIIEHNKPKADING